MRIAYLTMDEVNPDLAGRWADTCGCEVIPLSPSDPLPDGNFDAAIFDLDYLLPPLRQKVLAILLSDPLHCPVAVHSYNLRQRQANALRARGVLVRRRLECGILMRLRREVRRVQGEERQKHLVTLAMSQCPETDQQSPPSTRRRSVGRF
jgi:hypothetical protein